VVSRLRGVANRRGLLAGEKKNSEVLKETRTRKRQPQENQKSSEGSGQVDPFSRTDKLNKNAGPATVGKKSKGIGSQIDFERTMSRVIKRGVGPGQTGKEK